MSKRGQSGINALVGIDKPTGCSSHDVVDRVRKVLGERRVGHAGTLDPLASGVMVVGVGQATRLLGSLTAENKRYLARVSFGGETATDDAEGTITRVLPAPARVLDEGFARDSMALLLAQTSQVPPAYSAVSVGGRRAYAIARGGGQVELESRPIEVLSADLVGTGSDDCGVPYWDVVTRVSKGTYVRAMARDLGRSLGATCHLAALRRLSSGPVGIGSCLTPEGLAQAFTSGDLPVLDPVKALGCPVVELAEAELALLRNGQRLARPSAAGTADGMVALVFGDKLYGIGQADARGVSPKTVFVDGIRGVKQGERA